MKRFLVDFILNVFGYAYIWIEQFKRMQSSTYKDVFDVTYYCFACSENATGPLLPYLTALKIPYFRTGVFSIPTELYYTKDKLLENGDRWESVLAANIKADSPHR